MCDLILVYVAAANFLGGGVDAVRVVKEVWGEDGGSRVRDWRMLTYADVCWRMMTYADVCWRILTSAAGMGRGRLQSSSWLGRQQQRAGLGVVYLSCPHTATICFRILLIYVSACCYIYLASLDIRRQQKKKATRRSCICVLCLLLYLYISSVRYYIYLASLDIRRQPKKKKHLVFVSSASRYISIYLAVLGVLIRWVWWQAIGHFVFFQKLSKKKISIWQYLTSGWDNSHACIVCVRILLYMCLYL
jgi:hypothetical protein